MDREVVDLDLRGARLLRADLSGAVLRGAEVAGCDLDCPWLSDDGATLIVNGVDVVPLVEAELDRRFPGRGLRRAQDPDGLRAAWRAVERTWEVTLARAATMPTGRLEKSVDGEWSFVQTLRHLVMATDTWLGRAVLGREQPYHPLGLPNAEYASDGYDLAVFSEERPTYERVLEVRAERVAMVREALATITAEDLDAERASPWDPAHTETVRSCLHTILQEEWDHHRYAVRDLGVDPRS